ncbi:hypothetical protein OROMI_028857 [Orobanche minor]
MVDSGGGSSLEPSGTRSRTCAEGWKCLPEEGTRT